MNMLRVLTKTLLLCFLIIFPVSMYAQDGAYGAYTPYSIFGIGELRREGTAFNSSMGGVGIATRNKRFINYLNPASITARDSLSFMADIGLSQKNTLFRQGNMKSGNNTFNMYDFIISFPVYRSSAFMVGITPFSDLGYGFSTKVTDPQVIGNTNLISYSASGNGSVYQLFAGGARSTTAKLGVQYEQRIGEDMSMVFGATYRFRSGIRGSSENYETLGSVSDTLSYSYSNNSGVNIADELGVGLSFRKGDRWSVELNYLRSGWNRSGMAGTAGFAVDSDVRFTNVATNSVRAGFEIVPNRNDIRYYRKRMAYRAGAYYDESYYALDGNKVNSIGVTFGVTLPVFRWYNGITLGVDVGQNVSCEEALDGDSPGKGGAFLSMRGYALLSTRYSKSTVLLKPVAWGAGFHRTRKHNFHIVKDLYLFHFGCVDLARIEAKFADRERVAEGWSRHFRKRIRTIDVISKARHPWSWNSAVRFARTVQNMVRPPYAWNKPAMFNLKLVVRIPDRFRNMV